jgi:hypothetical protein
MLMPAVLSYPGVYIEEIPSGVRTITGVKTSVTAFVGYTKRGCTNKAVQIFNFGDFERNFGGLDPESDLSYAVNQYFLNGGSEAWVVRVASNAAKASITLRNGCGNSPNVIDVLKVEAKSEGNWGNNLRLDVDYDTSNPKSTFNLYVTEYIEKDGMLRPEHTEVYRNLSMNSFSADYAVDKINAGSSLITVSRLALPQTLEKGYSQSGSLVDDDLDKIDGDHNRLAITINGDGPYEFDIPGQNESIKDLNDLAKRITKAIQEIYPDQGYFECTAYLLNICVKALTGGEKSSVRFCDASMRNAAQILKLGINNGGTEVDSVASIRPAQTGTVGGTITLDTLPDSPFLYVNILENLTAVKSDIDTLKLWDPTSKPKSLEELRMKLALALSNLDQAELKDASVTLVDNCIRVIAGGTNSNRRLTFGKTNAITDDDSAKFSLSGINVSYNVSYNISRYSLGIGESWQAQTSPVPGFDGSSPGPSEFKGSRGDKKGLYALENVDLFNILCIPNEKNDTVLSEALAY